MNIMLQSSLEGIIPYPTHANITEVATVMNTTTVMNKVVKGRTE